MVFDFGVLDFHAYEQSHTNSYMATLVLLERILYRLTELVATGNIAGTPAM